jgi:hypothetical protein
MRLSEGLYHTADNRKTLNNTAYTAVKFQGIFFKPCRFFYSKFRLGIEISLSVSYAKYNTTTLPSYPTRVQQVSREF